MAFGLNYIEYYDDWDLFLSGKGDETEWNLVIVIGAGYLPLAEFYA